MPAFDLDLAGIPLRFSSETKPLLELLATYFRYYAPALRAAVVPALHIELRLVDALPAPETLLPCGAELLSQTGGLRLWRAAATAEAGPVTPAESFYFDAGLAAYQLQIAANTGTGYITEAAFAHPRILANTYTLFPLLLLLRAHGVYHLHAAAALSPGGKLCLFPAASRAGKTTLTTALGLAGWRPLADDSILLRVTEGGVSWTPLRKEFHLDERLLAAWPGLAPAEISHSYFGRACLAALDLFGTVNLAAQTFDHVDAFILPQIIKTAPSRLEPLASSAVLLKLAEQSMFLQLWRAHTERHFGALAALVQTAACYRLHSGPEILSDPLTVLLALQELA
jgi:hypothetical protein